jgi:addiction module HigA family antidote
MSTYYDPITPGQYLEHEFLEPLNITQTQLARDIDVSISRVSGIIHGSRAITADTAIRLGIYFKTTAQMWMNLQSQYDLQLLERSKLNLIKDRIRPLLRQAS